MEVRFSSAAIDEVRETAGHYESKVEGWERPSSMNSEMEFNISNAFHWLHELFEATSAGTCSPAFRTG